MRLINSDVSFVNALDYGTLIKTLNYAGKTCYKSYKKETSLESDERFIEGLVKHGHESVIEHVSVTVEFVVNRAISHQIVRHRVAAYSQESQRYCNYSKDKFDNEVTFIRPWWFDNKDKVDCVKMFEESCGNSEFEYFQLINNGLNPEDARGVLNNACATTLIATYNLREWRHIFKQRCFGHADPEIKVIMQKALKLMANKYPCIFLDLYRDLKNA